MLRQLKINSKKLGEVDILSYDEGVSVKTARLEFRSLSLEVPNRLFGDYTPMLCNPEICQMMGITWDSEKVRRYIDDNMYNYECTDYGAFSVYIVNTSTFIGSVQYHFVKDKYKSVGGGHENVFEIGYVIDKPYWGQGYGTEMARTAVKLIKKYVCPAYEAKQQPCPSEIVATVEPHNAASIKILQKTLKSAEKPDAISSELFFFRKLKKDKGVSDTQSQSQTMLCSVL